MKIGSFIGLKMFVCAYGDVPLFGERVQGRLEEELGEDELFVDACQLVVVDLAAVLVHHVDAHLGRLLGVARVRSILGYYLRAFASTFAHS